MMAIRKHAFALLAVLFAESAIAQVSADSAPWIVDPGFGFWGRATTNYANSPDYSFDSRTILNRHGLALQGSQILLARVLDSLSGVRETPGFQLYRITERGFRDLSFGPIQLSGNFIFSAKPGVLSPAMRARRIAIAADSRNRVYVGLSRDADIVLCAFDANGMPRQSDRFQGGPLPGCLSLQRDEPIDYPSPGRDWLGLQVDSADRVVIAAHAGGSTPGGRMRWLAARFIGNGAPDGGFGSNGRMVIDIPSTGRDAESVLTGMALSNAGSIYLVGTVLGGSSAGAPRNRVFLTASDEAGGIERTSYLDLRDPVYRKQLLQEPATGPIALDSMGRLLVSLLFLRTPSIGGMRMQQAHAGVARLFAASASIDANFGSGGIADAGFPPMIRSAALSPISLTNLVLTPKKGDYVSLTGALLFYTNSRGGSSVEYKDFLYSFDEGGNSNSREPGIVNYAALWPLNCRSSAMGPVVFDGSEFVVYAEAGGCFDWTFNGIPLDGERFVSKLGHL